MKILVLLPLDERYTHIATAIYKALPADVKDDTFAMPMFTEWQMATKHMVLGADLPVNWNIATFGTLVKARELYKLQEAAHKDFLLIGNISPDYEFDVVFNFQDAYVDEPYKDIYLDKLAEVFADDETLSQLLRIYTAPASTMTLHNYNATADFLSAYLKTDPHLDTIKEKYLSDLEAIKHGL